MNVATKNICVVGDAFIAFAKVANAVIYSEFVGGFEIGNGREASAPVMVYLGQGLNSEERSHVESLIQNSGGKYILKNSHWKLSSPALTHKHKQENIMLSEPHEIDGGAAYEAALVVDDSCAEMSDHLTGQHLQGTLIAEAARQMVLVVNEAYLRRRDPLAPKSVQFVTHSTSLAYHDYLFPIPVKVVYRTKSLRRGLGENYRSHATIEFFHGTRCHATCEFQFSVLESQFLQQQEQTLAQQSMNYLNCGGL